MERPMHGPARRLLRIVVTLAMILPIGTFTGSPAAAQAPLPNSMAAIGDSITQAVNVCCWYGNHPAQSWSTGGGAWDGIRSHYERILSVHPAISGNKNNNSASGAKMKHAPAQAAKAISQDAEYVTILMGANDICTSSRSTMTSVSDFRDRFEATMATLVSGLPNVRIFVSSIPNVHHLWKILHKNPVARLVWQLAKICQSMLSSSNTAADRRAVLTREMKFNRILGAVCAEYAKCRFDDHAVFNHDFTTSDVSKLDYFHPSLSGQAKLANLTWARSWWPA